MNMKDHILAALQEQFKSWEELLARLTPDEIAAPTFDLDWSIKDVIAHLWAWQQISIARVAAGLHDREPDFPKWIVSSIENWEDDPDGVNALTYERYHEKPWAEIHHDWREGFQQMLKLSGAISEKNLLDGDRYSWLKGYSLASILIASYDHHQEHLEELLQTLN